MTEAIWANITNAEKELNSCSVKDQSKATMFPEIMNLNLQTIDKQIAIYIRGGLSLDWITYPIQKKNSKFARCKLGTKANFS